MKIRVLAFRAILASMVAIPVAQAECPEEVKRAFHDAQQRAVVCGLSEENRKLRDVVEHPPVLFEMITLNPGESGLSNLYALILPGESLVPVIPPTGPGDTVTASIANPQNVCSVTLKWKPIKDGNQNYSVFNGCTKPVKAVEIFSSKAIKPAS